MNKIIFNEIQKILTDGNLKFKLNDKLNITLENILAKIKSYIKPNPQFTNKKFLIDISLLKRNDLNENVSNLIIEKEEIKKYFNEYNSIDDKLFAERKIK